MNGFFESVSSQAKFQFSQLQAAVSYSKSDFNTKNLKRPLKALLVYQKKGIHLYRTSNQLKAQARETATQMCKNRRLYSQTWLKETQPFQDLILRPNLWTRSFNIKLGSFNSSSSRRSSSKIWAVYSEWACLETKPRKTLRASTCSRCYTFRCSNICSSSKTRCRIHWFNSVYRPVITKLRWWRSKWRWTWA